MKKILKIIFNILKKALYYFVICFIFFIVFSLIIYFYIGGYSKKYIYSASESLPPNRVGLLLGTSPLTSAGTQNLYFKYRMQATYDLVAAGKIEYVIASGDNRTVQYNEPKYMKEALLNLGVKESRIIEDYGGRRTLDSVLRSNSIFKQNDITVISQRFHLERAIFLARKNGINAIGYIAQYPYPNNLKNLKTNAYIFIRELLARDLAIYDVVIQKRAQVLGSSIKIYNPDIDGIKKLDLQ